MEFVGPFAKIAVTYTQGGRWHVLEIHSLVSPNGERWDAVNGWTPQYDIPIAQIEEMNKRLDDNGGTQS